MADRTTQQIAGLVRRAGLACGWGLAVLSATPAAALSLQAEIALTSDYRYRGLSRSQGDPSVRLGVSGESRSGYYVGGELALIRQERQRGAELMLYGGRYFDWQPWYLEADLRHYRFSAARLSDYQEGTLLLGFGPLALDLAISDQFMQGQGLSRFARFSVDYDLSATLAVTAGIAHQDFQRGDSYQLGELRLNGVSSYLDWQLGYSQTEGRLKEEKRLQLTLSRRF